jgi:Zn finger protein HypA/HybF involved in hydrogenase expression
MSIIIAILVGGAALIAYCMIEKRINQRACPACGYTVSVDAPDEQCPRCDAIIRQDLRE